MTETHYFAARPAGPANLAERTVRLRGRDRTVVTADGVFSAERLDRGTAVLLSKVPTPAMGPGKLALDLGCGWGPVALALAAEANGAQVWAVDVNERARELTRANAQRAGLVVAVASPDEALRALGDRRVDLIWSNPPIRIGKGPLRKLLETWVGVLAEDGIAYLVVHKNLGADSLRAWMLGRGWGCEKIGSSKGFRVLAVTARPRT